jgi:cyclin-dependent kinase-like
MSYRREGRVYFILMISCLSLHLHKTKQLKYDNIVNLLDAFRRKGKLYLVFEYMDRTILEDLEKCPNGLRDDKINPLGRKYMWQILRAVDYLHDHNVGLLR